MIEYAKLGKEVRKVRGNKKKNTKFELIGQLALVGFLVLVILSFLWWDGKRKTVIAQKRVAEKTFVIVTPASSGEDAKKE